MAVRRLSARQLVIIAALIVVGFFTYQSGPSWKPSGSGDRAPAVSVTRSGTTPAHFDRIFAFGDSLSETLFNPDYDMPTDENPFGNTYPGITSTGGPNWLGYLIHDHLKTTWLYNLAMGGAQVSSAEFDDEPAGNRDMSFQVDTLLSKSKAGKAPTWKPETTLFTSWFGANDVHNGFWRMKTHDIHDHIIDLWLAQLDRLVALGAKNFLVMTPEPIHLTQYHKYGKGDGNKLLQDRLYDYNVKLAKYFQKWQARTGTNVYFVDATTLVEQALIDNVAKPCATDEDGGSPDECMWKDKFHLGIIPHRMIADAVAKALSA